MIEIHKQTRGDRKVQKRGDRKVHKRGDRKVQTRGDRKQRTKQNIERNVKFALISHKHIVLSYLPHYWEDRVRLGRIWRKKAHCLFIPHWGDRVWRIRRKKSKKNKNNERLDLNFGFISFGLDLNFVLQNVFPKIYAAVVCLWSLLKRKKQYSTSAGGQLGKVSKPAKTALGKLTKPARQVDKTNTTSDISHVNHVRQGAPRQPAPKPIIDIILIILYWHTGHWLGQCRWLGLFLGLKTSDHRRAWFQTISLPLCVTFSLFVSKFRDHFGWKRKLSSVQFLIVSSSSWYV